MPSDELVNAGDSALEAQKIFLAELDVRPYDKKNKAQSGKAKNTAYFKPESKGCVLPDRFGKAEKGKIYIFESDLDPPSLEDTPEEWLSKVL